MRVICLSYSQEDRDAPLYVLLATGDRDYLSEVKAKRALHEICVDEWRRLNPRPALTKSQPPYESPEWGEYIKPLDDWRTELNNITSRSLLELYGVQAYELNGQGSKSTHAID